MKAQTRGGSIPRILSGILSSPITPSLIGHESDDKYLCCFFLALEQGELMRLLETSIYELKAHVPLSMRRDLGLIQR